eukprot:INCI12721.1.p1 GENE.INCI12721.1~~INCI12721.1.p1  ORF type:complete len:343 (-),score=69.20 INCI12721.1:26-1054(-)
MTVVKCGELVTGNVKTLLVTIALFAAITVAQVIVSLIANSSALLVDSIAMAMDTLLFCGNLIAECIQDKKARKRGQLIAAGLSFGGLIAVCVWAFFDTIPAVLDGVPTPPNCTLNVTTLLPGEDGEEQCCTAPSSSDVDGVLVLAFALFGVVFDVSSFIVFKYCSQFQALESEDDDDDDDVTKKHNLREISDGRSDEARDHDALANVVEATQSARSRCMNMLSALSHVGADFLRSITTLILATLLLTTPCAHEKGEFEDAAAGAVITALIALGIIPPLYVWVKEIIAVNREAKSSAKMRAHMVREAVDAFKHGNARRGSHAATYAESVEDSTSVKEVAIELT